MSTKKTKISCNTLKFSARRHNCVIFAIFYLFVNFPHIYPLTAPCSIRLSEFIFLSRSSANVPCCHTPQGNYYEGAKTGGTLL